MPQPAPSDDRTVVQDFQQTLLALQELYRECAQDYADRHPELIQDSAKHFVGRMVELHRGLILKVFVEMVLAGHRLTPAELELAQALFAHAWDRHLSAANVKETLFHYSETTHLRWESLLGPFERLSSFQRRAAEVQELVLHLAQLIARAGGHPDPRKERQLQWIRMEMKRVLERVPLAGSLPPAAPAGKVAVKLESALLPHAQPPASDPGREAGPAGVQSLAEVLDELDQLIGLDPIKHDVRELVNFLKMQEERKKFDLPQTPLSLHAVFTGNPGTGKTTVARLYGRILGAMGILARGHLVETDRSGLVAEYAGQTGPRTNRRVEEALGGVLFIDEAYSLVADAGEDPYGMEALQALLKRMEDDRDRFVVILAGYPRPMQHLLRTNPGLSSRCGRTFAFPDYSAVELGRIFEVMCHRDRYRLPARTRAKLLLGFQHLLDHRDEHFGNGRLARNVFERSVRRLASRLAGVQPLTRALLTTLEPEDVEMEGVPAECWDGLEADAFSFRLTCPGCGHASAGPQKFLGQQVKCPACGISFEAGWGAVLPVARGAG